MSILDKKLSKVQSLNNSGKLKDSNKIPLLKESHYYVKNYDLDGDAPKEFIRVYEYKKNSGIRKNYLKTWTPYIAKSAEKWYPHESVIEYVINKIGETIGLEMNETKLYCINKQIRFLSKYFLKSNEQLIHGAEICGQYLDDSEMAKEIAENVDTARDLFSFEFIEDAIRVIFPKVHEEIIFDLIKMIAFDAIVGNNDRHFYNWGVISKVKKSPGSSRFSPIYDSARGLLWNFSDETIKKYFEAKKNGGMKVDKYINNAKPRISIEKNKNANHFELIKSLKSNAIYKALIDELVSIENENKVIDLYVKEFKRFFIIERNELILYIIKKRFELIRKL